MKIGQQELMPPINYDKIKAKKKFKVITEPDQDSGPENPRSPDLEDDDYNQIFKMETLPKYGRNADVSNSVSFNTQNEEP